LDDVSKATIRQAVAVILTELGYDLADQHFQRTPERSAEVLSLFAANGSNEEAGKLLEVIFDSEHDSLVQVGPITIRSFCAHHMLPVTGAAWVGYIPENHVVGLSKLARVVYHYAQQFTVQERVTQQIANLLWEQLKPLGVMVVIRASHGCMSMRGVLEPNAVTSTSAVRGVFKDEDAARAEFMSFVEKGKQ
jgi:GTP cyclohydrolase I